MDSSPVPVCFRTLYDFDLSEAIDFYDSMTFMILSHKSSIVVVKVLNTLIRQSFSSWSREN